MFLDSDDFLHLDTVKILKHKLLNSSYDAVFFDAEIICEKGMEFVRKNDYDRSKANLDGKLFCGYEYFAECYPNNYVVSSCMAIYKRKRIVSANIKFPEGIYFEDNYFTLMFICQAKCVIHISEKLYQRRYRENSITTSKYSERKFMDYIKCFLLIVDKIYQMDYLKLREKFLEFISDWLNNGFSNYLMCKEQDIILSENAIYLFNSMQKAYVYLLNKLYINISFLNLVLLNKLLKNYHYMMLYKFDNKKYIEEKINEIINIEKRLYFHILNELPLNQKCKIGVYGSGKHTEGVINIFEKLIGEISCDLIFLDSKKDNEEYRGKKVINYQKINNEDLDLIIISSFLYEKEMIANIKSINIDTSIYTFYHTLEGDVFSEYEIFLAHY